MHNSKSPLMKQQNSIRITFNNMVHIKVCSSKKKMQHEDILNEDIRNE